MHGKCHSMPSACHTCCGVCMSEQVAFERSLKCIGNLGVTGHCQRHPHPCCALADGVCTCFALSRQGHRSDDQCLCWKSGASAWLAAARNSRSTGCICLFECIVTCCCPADAGNTAQKPLCELRIIVLRSMHSSQLLCMLRAPSSWSVLTWCALQLHNIVLTIVFLAVQFCALVW